MSSPDREMLITDSQGQTQLHKGIAKYHGTCYSKSQMPSVFQESTMFSLSHVPA